MLFYCCFLITFRSASSNDLHGQSSEKFDLACFADSAALFIQPFLVFFIAHLDLFFLRFIRPFLGAFSRAFVMRSMSSPKRFPLWLYPALCHTFKIDSYACMVLLFNVVSDVSFDSFRALSFLFKKNVCNAVFFPIMMLSVMFWFKMPCQWL